jgi:hypothetical protein
MHAFFKTQPVIEGYTILPTLLGVVRWHFQDKNLSSMHAIAYAEYFTEQYAKNFDGALEFDQATEVELVSYHGDHKTWEISPEDIVSEYFQRIKYAAPDDAEALAQAFFVSLREQLSEYAVMMFKDKAADEVIIVTGLKAAEALRDEKVNAFVRGPHQPCTYNGIVHKVAYAK